MNYVRAGSRSEVKARVSLLSLNHHLAAIDDVQTLAGTVDALAGEVEDRGLASGLGSIDVGDACGGIVLPCDGRLAALTGTIVDALDTDLLPSVEHCCIVVEVDAV